MDAAAVFDRVNWHEFEARAQLVYALRFSSAVSASALVRDPHYDDGPLECTARLPRRQLTTTTREPPLERSTARAAAAAAAASPRARRLRGQIRLGRLVLTGALFARELQRSRTARAGLAEPE